VLVVTNWNLMTWIELKCIETQTCTWTQPHIELKCIEMYCDTDTDMDSID